MSSCIITTEIFDAFLKCEKQGLFRILTSFRICNCSVNSEQPI
jgi:hypothetical protein